MEPEMQGAKLRHSCLCDQLELQAIINGASYSEAALSDRIENSSWSNILSPKLSNEAPLRNLGQTQDKCREIAAQIIDSLKERANLLGDRYPFSFSRYGSLRFTGEESPYLWLLWISLSHCYRIDGGSSATTEFEKLVTRALKGAKLQSATFGTAEGATTFLPSLEKLVQEFENLIATPENVIHPTAAKDCGADTIATFPMGSDRRAGQCCFVGQSTLAKSDDWGKKIPEAKIGFWSKALGERVIIVPFFATPYHVPQPYLQMLVQDYGHTIWDRTRLVRHLVDSEFGAPSTLNKLQSLELI